MSTPAQSRLERLSDLVLTVEFKQRRCLSVLLLTALIMLSCLMLMALGAARGVFQARHVAVLATLCLLTTGSFYAIMRSGLNQRCSEPTLALPQMLVAQSMIAATYGISGPVRGATIVMLVLVMVFGMFNLRVSRVRLMGAYTIAVMGLVMAWRANTDPQHYRPDIEWLHFGLVATVMLAISQLSVQLMEMRTRLKSQKLALEGALAHIQEMATRDDLTGLINRRCMLALLREHAMRLARGGPAFYIAMVDLDHFKLVNDSYGHAVGDEVLCAFARHARAILRNTDIIGRWGGEEFLLLLPETPPGEPTVGVERLRAGLALAAVSVAEPQLRVAFSAGFTRYIDGEPLDDTIERADRALYGAKAAGRNQTIML
ncbi:MAG: diguanylate cyclase [Pseudomonadota bacterium]